MELESVTIILLGFPLTYLINLGLFRSLPQNSTTNRPNVQVISAEAPSEKGANGLWSLYFPGILTRTVVAPIERVKLLIQKAAFGAIQGNY